MQAGSREKNSIRNVIFGYTNQVFSLILYFIARTVFIEVLGAEYLGISGLFSDVLKMLSMADLGFGIAMSYSFYQPVAEHDETKIAALIHFYKKIYNGIAVITTLVGVMLIPLLKYIVNMDSDMPYLTIYYLFFLADTVISYLFVYKTSIITASQKNYLISKYQMIVNISKTIIQIGALIAFRNYFVYLFISILATLANNLLASYKAENLYPEIKLGYSELDSTSKKTIVENMKSVFIYKLSSVLLTGTDNTLISIIVGTMWVGIYSNYNLVINGINNLINILFTSVTASIGNLVVTEKSEKRYEVFRIMNLISLIISAVTVIIMANLINDLIFVWLGKPFVLSNDIKIAILCNFYLGNILRPIWSYREATGLYMKTKYIMLIAAILNCVLSIILGYKWGMAGILFASAISRISTYFWYEPRLLFTNYFEEKTNDYYLAIIKNVLLTVTLCVVIDLLGQNYYVDSWQKLIMKFIFVAGAAMICIIGSYIRAAEMKSILMLAKNIFKKQRNPK